MKTEKHDKPEDIVLIVDNSPETLGMLNDDLNCEGLTGIGRTGGRSRAGDC